MLFNGPQQLPVNALIEMVFEMPEEISGQKNSNVVCQGRVMRSRDAEGRPRAKKEEVKDKDAEDLEVNDGLLAASIVDYKFIH